MNTKKKEKTYYRVTFTNETSENEELYQVCARNVSASDLYGLVELSDFIFPENKLVYSPAEERVRKEFGDIRRTWIPFHAIVRIDELPESTESEIKVVSLEAHRRSDERMILKKP